MSERELEVLSRAHRLFAGLVRHAPLDPGTGYYDGVLRHAAAINPGWGHQRYENAVQDSRAALRSAALADSEFADIITHARDDYARGRQLTRGVLDEARADAATRSDTPLAQREAIRRRVARMRAQRAHVLWARGQALQHQAALRALRYRILRRRALTGSRTPSAGSRAGVAVRAALSRLGCPYVWGAAGPDRFDCSGLVQWAYAQAGVHVDRTTYQQIHDGIPIPRSQVRPGDLVFPHAGHVQMAIGNNLVIEAPHAGAPVRISQLGVNVQIRRPVI
ncbi:C40 family peptidase [Mycobacterium botniense]|uniref:NLP/P60 family protein n=1 Tax=Mycobacterium botniense TaxID=84962 RepID=A0A7I9XVB9_9MYCO|nr:C40 family peptidase [Mycobacterium botniense]GFG73740.1 NLP/P60 family protein [Mycobacterium botniense]